MLNYFNEVSMVMPFLTDRHRELAQDLKKDQSIVYYAMQKELIV